MILNKRTFQSNPHYPGEKVKNPFLRNSTYVQQAYHAVTNQNNPQTLAKWTYLSEEDALWIIDRLLSIRPYVIPLKEIIERGCTSRRYATKQLAHLLRSVPYTRTALDQLEKLPLQWYQNRGIDIRDLPSETIDLLLKERPTLIIPDGTTPAKFAPTIDDQNIHIIVDDYWLRKILPLIEVGELLLACEMCVRAAKGIVDPTFYWSYVKKHNGSPPTPQQWEDAPRYWQASHHMFIGVLPELYEAVNATFPERREWYSVKKHRYKPVTHFNWVLWRLMHHHRRQRSYAQELLGWYKGEKNKRA